MNIVKSGNAFIITAGDGVKYYLYLHTQTPVTEKTRNIQVNSPTSKTKAATTGPVPY